MAHVWTKEATCALIEEYEKNSVLWNLKCEGYRNREIRNKVISGIALQFECTAGEVQRKLHNLRNQVSQELNKIKKKKSGSGTDEVYTSTWPYFSALKFLIPGLINRPTPSNVGGEEDTPGGINREETQEAGNNIEEQIKETAEQEKVRNQSTKRRNTSDDNNAKALKRALEIMQKELDENERFGEYVAIELKSVKLDSNRRRLKSEIRKAITRIADEDDNFYSPSVSTVSSQHPSPLYHPAQSSSPYLVSSPPPSPSPMTYQQLPGSCIQYNIPIQYDQATFTVNTACSAETGNFQQL